jgi:hypothetical protein
MIEITGTMEDQKFLAIRDASHWTVHVRNRNKQETFHASDEEFGAVMALAVAGDFEDGEVNSKLFTIAERVQSDDIELRLIP